MCNLVNYCHADTHYDFKKYSYQEFIKNKELNEDEIKMGRVMLQSKPRMLMIVLTTRCNLECIMCSRSNPRKDSTLPYDTVKKIRSLFPYLETIDWQGGEVFLIDYFKDLFLEAKTYSNIDQSIVTNGLLIDEDWVRIFANSKVNLTFSIDAVTKETYEYIRKRAQFEHLLENLKMINKSNKRYNNSIQLHINTVVMRSNYKELDLFPEFCQRYGIKHLRLDFLRPEIVPDEDIFINPDINALKYLQVELEKVERKCRELNIWFEYTFKPFISTIKSYCTDSAGVKTFNGISKHNSTERKLKCKLPWKKVYIDACSNGIVRPDCLCEHNAGNIFDSPIEEIWNNAVMQLYRNKLINECMQGWCSKICLDNAVDTYQLEGIH